MNLFIKYRTIEEALAEESSQLDGYLPPDIGTLSVWPSTFIACIANFCTISFPIVSSTFSAFFDSSAEPDWNKMPLSVIVITRPLSSIVALTPLSSPDFAISSISFFIWS